MIILFVFSVVAILAGLGFATNWVWFLAVCFLVFWLVGVALGRRENAGRHRFYRW